MYSDGNSSDEILNRMKGTITSDIDKSEGSFVFDALSPTSKELAATYISNDDILQRTNPYTAIGVDLENITKPYGVIRKDGGKATTQILVTAKPGTSIKANTLVQTLTGLIYEIINDTTIVTDTTLIDIEALNIGSAYNVPSNIIIQLPVQVEGVISISNPNPVTNGYDNESNDSLRQRYFERLQTPATSGNKYHYKNWAKEVIGVGDAKVFPLWNGNGTVKVVIVNSNKRSADTTLINAVVGHIEENRPMGANVTVVSAKEKSINVSATLIIDSKKYTLNQLQTALERNLTKYFSDIAFINNYISYASIGNLIFNTDGVIDYSNLLDNEGITNITLEDEEIPTLGIVSLGV